MHKVLIANLSAIFLTMPLSAQDVTGESALTIADTRAELAGQWQGTLEYRDYQADRWFGIPVVVDVELIDDGATVIRKSRFDDGSNGTVYITTVSMLSTDGETDYVGSFRADRPAEMSSFELSLQGAIAGTPMTATNWTLIGERDGQDDNRPARIRETTIRDGDSLVILKEVDFSDDDDEEWLSRNRIVLEKRVTDTAVHVRIEGFECGDNCYLNYSMIADKVTETQSALCNVDACKDWFADQAMPPEFTGRPAIVTLGKGKQYDNDGNIMSDDFPEINSITLDQAE